MKWSWRKALGIASEPVTLAAPAPPERVGLRISPQQLIESGHKPPEIVPEQIFAPYRPAPGTIPGMAQDAALPVPYNNLTALNAWAVQGAVHEGLTFLGYPYLAQLSQRAEYRHAAEIVAEHVTRKWIELKGDEEKVGQIDAELKRLGVRDAFQTIAVKDGIFGRCQLFLDFDDADRETETSVELILKPEKINKDRPLLRVKVVEPMWSYPAPYQTSNPLAEGFYAPAAWIVQGQRVHSTRLLTFVGREVPDILKPAYAFGGQSLTALMKPYVDNWLRARQSVSDMLHSFSTMVLSTDLETMLAPGAQTSVAARLQYFINNRDNNGFFVVNKSSEELKNVSAQIAGLEGLLNQAQEQCASAARIPLSIYIQATPEGLNASSEGEIRSFNADIKAYQEKVFRSPLKRIIEIVQLSLFGEIDPDIDFIFVDLWEMSDKERAEIDKAKAEASATYINAGVVSNEEVREAVAADEDGIFSAIKLTGPAPELPEPDLSADPDENADMGQDEWNEADHPRDDIGRFGIAGGEIHPSLKAVHEKADRAHAIMKDAGLHGIEVSHSQNRDGQFSSYIIGYMTAQTPDGREFSAPAGIRVSDHAVSSGRVERDRERIQYYLEAHGDDKWEWVKQDIARRQAALTDKAGKAEPRASEARSSHSIQVEQEQKAAVRREHRDAHFRERGIDLNAMSKGDREKAIKQYNRDHPLE